MFTLPPLSYDYSALEPFIDKETMRIHHTKHHAAYVQNLNDVLRGNEELLTKNIFELVKGFKDVPKDILTKVKNNAGGHANHSFFWKIMAPKPKKEPNKFFLAVLKQNFGGFKDFQQAFSASAMGRFGSGWAWLILNRKKLEIVGTANQDSVFTLGFNPILALDVWEHAYYLRYQNRKSDYIDAWWNMVNWEAVESLYKEAIKK